MHWEKFRELVLDTYREAWLLLQGTLLCPPIKKDGLVKILFELDHGEDAEEAVNRLSSTDKYVVSVSYPETPPKEWAPDL